MKNCKKGYSLIEVVVTVIIAGVVASFALINYGKVIERQRAKEGEQLLLAIFSKAQALGIEYNYKCPGVSVHLDISSTPIQNFETPIVSCFTDPPNPRLTPMKIVIQRSDGSYALIIDTSSGVAPWKVVCTGATAGICESLGYDFVCSRSLCTPPPE